jgi:mono/diheme cytochrome c family protein
MRTNTLLSLAFLMVAGGALAGCGEEPIPASVSYERDIKPLMQARCIRCHGAGGMPNKEPGLPAWFVGNIGDTPKASSDLTTFESTKRNSGLFKLYIDPRAANPMGTPPSPAVPYLMPPPPAPPLTTREHDMLLKWAANPLP